MKQLIIPKNYKSTTDLLTTQKEIKFVKDTFERLLAESLCLTRVTAPILVLSNTGVNDDLNGVERPARFDIKEIGKDAEIVHSLAKWKRLALKKYAFEHDTGLYTDMNAIRRDDDMDNFHSIYVDQWDWEKVISREERSVEYLKHTVQCIVDAIYEVNERAKALFSNLNLHIEKKVKFITTQEALDMYPNCTSKEIENNLTKEFGTVFLMQIGKKLSNGKPHDGRAPDYDDWSLNGDILFYDDVLDRSIEISSMGIRVDETSLYNQLAESNKLDRLTFDYHKGIIDKKLPLTIGGGIGQSRLCMFILQKAHIGEVQVSLWPEGTEEECKKYGIEIL